MNTSKELQPGQRPDRMPHIHFAIVGNQRTGSSHLNYLLDSHPEIACWDGELFKPGEEFDAWPVRDPRDFLLRRVFVVNAPVIGFKWMVDGMTYVPRCWDLIEEFGIRLVHTIRDNRLEQFLSLQLAILNNAFNDHYGSYKVNRITIERRAFLQWLAVAEKADEMIARQVGRRRIPRLVVEYEELCRGQDRVLDFLGAPRRTLTSPLSKQRQGDLADSIANFVELQKSFVGTRFARYFQ
jgi:hypothetical protein